MFDELVDIAKRTKKDNIKGVYIPTAKNKFVADLYDSLGFKKIKSPKDKQNESHYTIEIKDIKPLNRSIKVINE